MANLISSFVNAVPLRPGICDNDINSLYPYQMKIMEKPELFHRKYGNGSFRWGCNVKFPVSHIQGVVDMIRKYIPGADYEFKGHLEIILTDEADDAQFGFLVKTGAFYKND